MKELPIRYWLKYSLDHVYFSFRTWQWIVKIYDNKAATRAGKLEFAMFWYYLGSTPELDFFDSEYYFK